MTESEWLDANKPLTMLGYLVDTAERQHYPDRKFRLFACACVRRLGPHLTDHRSWQAVQTAERFAEGRAGKRILERARRAAQEAAILHWQDWQQRGISEIDMQAAQAAVDTTIERGIFAAWEVCQSACLATVDADARAQCELLREFFGNPFRRPTLPEGWQRWNDRLLVRLAQQIREEQRWADLAVLADALEEAGCSDETILLHCRYDTEHLRGCWVLDLLCGED